MQATPAALLLLIFFLRAASGLWTTSSLSVARAQLASTSLAVYDVPIVFFAGGTGGSGNMFSLRSLSAFLGSLHLISHRAVSKVVDIFDVASGSWSTESLSQPRKSLSATSLSSMALFAGGCSSSGAPSQFVFIF